MIALNSGASDRSTPSTTFAFPAFFNYPPYFTVQPVQATQDKQKALWRDLILKYCRQQRIYQLSTDADDDCPLFHNPAIKRRLTKEAKTLFLEDVVKHGRAQWLDRERRRCLVLWKTYDEWAAILRSWAEGQGLSDEVVLLDDLHSGEDVFGTELQGVDRLILLKAVRILEVQGKARLFTGNSPEEEGVKFF